MANHFDRDDVSNLNIVQNKSLQFSYFKAIFLGVSFIALMSLSARFWAHRPITLTATASSDLEVRDCSYKGFPQAKLTLPTLTHVP